jgi:hypothetical protein
MLVCGFAAEGAVKCNTVEIKVDKGLCAGRTVKSHKGCFDKEAAATDANSMDNYIKVRVAGTAGRKGLRFMRFL